MTTPKELADKARAYLLPYRHAPNDMLPELRDEFHATIDQLQAMAEARQGSGEPVAYWIPRTEQFCIADKSGRPFAKAWEPLYDAPPSAQQSTVEDVMRRLTEQESRHVSPENVRAVLRALNSAPPSAQQATCRDDGRCQYAIDHGAEGMGHCPPGKCAMPHSAQQATGSGQVLTDEVGRLTSALRNMRSNAAPRALSWTWADCKVASEAADMLDRLAAPTTGKREPLTNEQIDDAAWAGGLTCRDGSCAFVAGTDLRPHIRGLVRALHGITGEQR